MTRQAKKVLNDLRECQVEQGDMIQIDFRTGCYVAWHHHKPTRYKKMTYTIPETESIVEYLIEESMLQRIERVDFFVVVTHRGNEYDQIRTNEVISLILRSIATPIVVALLTSLIFNVCARWFPWFEQIK